MALDKAKKAAYMRDYTRKNKDRIAKQRQKRYAKNRETHRALSRARWESRKDKTKDYKLRKLYGITLEDWKTLYAKQDGYCAICKDVLGITQINVDHCHTTSIVRGLLCNRCNVLIGNAKDDTDILANAINYLKQYK